MNPFFKEQFLSRCHNRHVIPIAMSSDSHAIPNVARNIGFSWRRQEPRSLASLGITSEYGLPALSSSKQLTSGILCHLDHRRPKQPIFHFVAALQFFEYLVVGRAGGLHHFDRLMYMRIEWLYLGRNRAHF